LQVIPARDVARLRQDIETLLLELRAHRFAGLGFAAGEHDFGAGADFAM